MFECVWVRLGWTCMYNDPSQLFLSLFLALAVCQEREEEEDDGRDGRGEVRANTGCSLPFCKEFDFNPFKIKDKIAGVIGFKKAAKNFIVTEVKNVREKFARKSEKINQIKKFFGDVIDTK